MQTPPEIADLLSHADWVRALARELVRDPHHADDVVQETWIAALRRPPSDDSNVRGWLATVVRNVVRGNARANVRRIKREEEGARAEGLPPEHEVAERAQLQQELIEHVLKLDESYRAVLLLRYFDGLPPRTIAARLKIPVATVRTRHARGLEQLRERLTRERGGEAEWTRELSALAAVGTAGSAPLVLWLGGLLMSAQVKVWTAATVIVLAAIGGWWAFGRESVDASTAVAQDTREHVLDEPTLDTATIESARQVVSAEAPRRDEVPAPAAVPAVSNNNAGRVLDTHGRPVPSARLVLRSAFSNRRMYPTSPELIERELAGLDASRPQAELSRKALALLDDTAAFVTVDEQGRFEVPASESDAVVIWARGWVTISTGWRRTESDKEELVVVAERSGTLTGKVVDERGNPVPSASLYAVLVLPALATFPYTLQRGQACNLGGGVADASGRFELVGMPLAEGLRIKASAKGFQPYISRAIDAQSGEAVEIVLRAADASQEVDIEGRVVDANGRGIPDAAVSFVNTGDMTDANGSFRLRIDRESAHELDSKAQREKNHRRFDLVAMSMGFQAAVIEDFGAQLDDPIARTGVVLRLAAPALTIQGRVIDHEGSGRPGVEVILVDPTALGNTSGTAEEVASRVRTKSYNDPKFVTDSEGRFEIDGLLARDYTLLAIDLERTLAVKSAPVPAGTREVILREPKREQRESVRGQVVSNGGRPLSGVEVSVEFRIVRSNGMNFSRSLPAVRTNEEGRFEFSSLPPEHGSLRIGGENVPRCSIALDGYVPGREWRIAVPVSARFKVELSTQDVAKEIGLLDADGKSMRIELLRADGGRSSYDRVSVAAAASSVLTADDRATTLVLYADDAEIRRVPVQLSAGELTVLRP